MSLSVGPKLMGLKGAEPAHPNQRFSAQLNFMKILKPRSRMLSIRLSEEEYAGLCRLSAEVGARSLSDLARDAMRKVLDVSPHRPRVTDSADLVRVQMEDINRRIDELREQMMSSERSKSQPVS